MVAGPRPLDPFLKIEHKWVAHCHLWGVVRPESGRHACSSDSPKQWVRQTAGAAFESIRRIARRQVYGVVRFDTDGKRGEGRTSGLSEMGL